MLVDTSIAVAFLSGDHPGHELVFGELSGCDLGLCGHAAFETFSVLTRLPPPARRTPTVVAGLLESNFPLTRFLGPDRARDLLRELAAQGVGGGSVYDALVGATAVEHTMTLVSRDVRARTTYRAVGADVEMLS